MNHETKEEKKFSTSDPKFRHHLIFLLRFGQTRLVADEGVDGVLALNLMQYALAAGQNATLNSQNKILEDGRYICVATCPILLVFLSIQS